jgi:integrase/recombinase XerD
MKVARHGQATILTQRDIERLFNEGFTHPRDRALFGVCLYTGCRIAEACSMLWIDAFSSKGKVRSPIILRKANTKGKQATRSIPPHGELVNLLVSYCPDPEISEYLFPGRWNGHLHPTSADKILRDICSQLGLLGVSTHSFRRTALTSLSSAGVPLRIIQRISGHESLSALQRYLEVTEEQVRNAITAMKF